MACVRYSGGVARSFLAVSGSAVVLSCFLSFSSKRNETFSRLCRMFPWNESGDRVACLRSIYFTTVQVEGNTSMDVLYKAGSAHPIPSSQVTTDGIRGTPFHVLVVCVGCVAGCASMTRPLYTLTAHCFALPPLVHHLQRYLHGHQ